jgi:hypothetical protein
MSPDCIVLRDVLFVTAPSVSSTHGFQFTPMQEIASKTYDVRVERRTTMATSVRQFENALQAILNLHYLIEVDVSNPSHVLRFVKMTEPSVKTLTTLLTEMRATG